MTPSVSAIERSWSSVKRGSMGEFTSGRLVVVEVSILPPLWSRCQVFLEGKAEEIFSAVVELTSSSSKEQERQGFGGLR